MARQQGNLQQGKKEGGENVYFIKGGELRSGTVQEVDGKNSLIKVQYEEYANGRYKTQQIWVPQNDVRNR
ncbi:MAG: hypothetical protein ACM3UU_09035 [Ignavibacteriales bacterium]